MYNIEITPSLVWDNAASCMVSRKAVVVQIVGNKGTVYAEEGPMYAQTAQEVFEAVQILKARLCKELSFGSEISGEFDSPDPPQIIF